MIWGIIITMKSNKLCLIYNTAPHYREAIFRLIDETYDCDWFFGKPKNDIREMDWSKLKHIKFLKTIGNPDKASWRRGMIRQLFKKKYRTYFMLGETRSISTWFFILLASLLFHKKRIYLWTHGWYGKESDIDAKLKLWMYRHVTGIFLYGNYAKDLLIKKGIDQRKLFVIHNSLNYDRQVEIRRNLKKTDLFEKHFGNTNHTIIFIGRLTEVKRLDLLIDAIAQLKTEGEEYNVVFVGNGEKKTDLETYVRAKNLDSNFWFYGACYDESENAELIYNSDLCVAPGNVGLTAMHSLVFGTPVATHNRFELQMPEFEAVHNNITGVFFNYNDSVSIAKCISDWFKSHGNQTEREKVRQACCNEIDKYWTPEFQINVIKQHLIIQ